MDAVDFTLWHGCERGQRRRAGMKQHADGSSLKKLSYFIFIFAVADR